MSASLTTDGKGSMSYLDHVLKLNSRPALPGLNRRFTLIELLVVIVVIAILLAMLLPALHRAKVTTQKTVCGHNQKEIGIGWTVYATDYDNWYPTPGKFVSGHPEYQNGDLPGLEWHDYESQYKTVHGSNAEFDVPNPATGTNWLDMSWFHYYFAVDYIGNMKLFFTPWHGIFNDVEDQILNNIGFGVERSAFRGQAHGRMDLVPEMRGRWSYAALGPPYDTTFPPKAPKGSIWGDSAYLSWVDDIGWVITTPHGGKDTVYFQQADSRVWETGKHALFIDGHVTYYTWQAWRDRTHRDWN